MPQSNTGVRGISAGEGVASFAQGFLQRFLADRDQRAAQQREDQAGQQKYAQQVGLQDRSNEQAISRGQQLATFEHELTVEDEKRLKTLTGVENAVRNGAPITPALVAIYAKASKHDPATAEEVLRAQADAGKSERSHELQGRSASSGNKGQMDITEATRALRLRYGMGQDDNPSNPDDFNNRIEALRKDPEGGTALLELEGAYGKPKMIPKGASETQVNSGIKNFESGWNAHYNNEDKNRGTFQQALTGASTPPIDPRTKKPIVQTMAHDVAEVATRQNISPDEAAIIVASQEEISALSKEHKIDDTSAPLFSKEDAEAAAAAIGARIPIGEDGLSINILGSMVGAGLITREQALKLIDRLKQPESRLGANYRALSPSPFETVKPKSTPVSKYLRK